jgi:hypothetical protein
LTEKAAAYRISQDIGIYRPAYAKEPHMNTFGQKKTAAPAARDIVIALVVLGSIWGFLEVGLGGAMQAGNIPYKGDILTGLGIGLMAIGFAFFRKPLMLIGIAALAVMVRQMAIPMLHLSTFCKANSSLAVLLGGGALAGSVAVAGRRLGTSKAVRVAAGFAAGLMAGVGFYFIGMRVAPCRYLMSFNRPGGLVAWMAHEGFIWAGLGAVFFPLGYLVGERMRDRVLGWRLASPRLYYAASGAVIAFCWVASALAISGGY